MARKGKAGAPRKVRTPEELAEVKKAQRKKANAKYFKKYQQGKLKKKVMQNITKNRIKYFSTIATVSISDEKLKELQLEKEAAVKEAELKLKPSEEKLKQSYKD